MADKLIEKGTISVQMENIFPIIKKWLYSEKDIFLRELVSNSVDAINKLRHLQAVGEFKGLQEGEEYQIEVSLDKDRGTITVKDNGIGMTEDEVKRYINEVAFSSAQEFLEKYKAGDEGSQIIGHFGLGFYSSFMVSKLVEIKTLSYIEGSKPVIWSCDGSPEYTVAESDKTDRGMEVILHISDEEKEYLEPARIRHVLDTYCDFLPIPIKLSGEPINTVEPIWMKKPQDLKDEDYLKFYRHLYPFEEDPLFWIHINVEFPVRARGVLYFPKLRHELDPTRGKIRFYYNQVYVSDNLKDLIPEFLTSLQGAIDCPDMPLNVSRSYLQNDPTMKKLSSHITKKVADELSDLYKSNRETYIKYWEDIHPFIKFGAISNEKFYDQVKDILIFKSSKGEYLTLEEYLERNKESSPNKVYYASDEVGQSFYLNLCTQGGMEVLILSSLIDSHFIQFLEAKNREIKFARIDSEACENIIDKEAGSKIVDPRTNKTLDEEILELFKNSLSIPELTIKVEHLKTEEIPAMILIDEYQRRFKEMAVLLQRTPSEKPVPHTLVVNGANGTIRNLRKMSGMLSPDADAIRLLCEFIYDTALLGHKSITPERLEKLLSNSYRIAGALSDKIAGVEG